MYVHISIEIPNAKTTAMITTPSRWAWLDTRAARILPLLLPLLFVTSNNPPTTPLIRGRKTR